MIDAQTGMVRMLQATLDAVGQGPGDLTERVRSAMDDVPADQITALAMMLKSSRCLEITAERTEAGEPVVTAIKGNTTRGLRELQKASLPPTAVHSCPTDGEDGRLSFN
ncbi:MAG TPA: hypothetical protein VHL54_13175 [Actinomycetota bacterium]|nr:hypothetical protein [Actinomycetota bacterium]